jgi:hypothetical protein
MNDEILQKVVTFLNRKEIDFLDEIEKDILFSKGKKIPRATLLKKIIDIFLNSYGKNGENYQELIETITRELTKGGRP